MSNKRPLTDHGCPTRDKQETNDNPSRDHYHREKTERTPRDRRHKPPRLETTDRPPQKSRNDHTTERPTRNRWKTNFFLRLKCFKDRKRRTIFMINKMHRQCMKSCDNDWDISAWRPKKQPKDHYRTRESPREHQRPSERWLKGLQTTLTERTTERCLIKYRKVTIMSLRYHQTKIHLRKLKKRQKITAKALRGNKMTKKWATRTHYRFLLRYKRWTDEKPPRDNRWQPRDH